MQTSKRKAARPSSTTKKGKRYAAPKKADAIKIASLKKDLSAKINRSIEQHTVNAASSGKLTILKNSGSEDIKKSSSSSKPSASKMNRCLGIPPPNDYRTKRVYVCISNDQTGTTIKQRTLEEQNANVLIGGSRRRTENDNTTIKTAGRASFVMSQRQAPSKTLERKCGVNRGGVRK